jgi:hypothetical protein
MIGFGEGDSVSSRRVSITAQNIWVSGVVVVTYGFEKGKGERDAEPGRDLMEGRNS